MFIRKGKCGLSFQYLPTVLYVHATALRLTVEAATLKVVGGGVRPAVRVCRAWNLNEGYGCDALCIEVLTREYTFAIFVARHHLRDTAVCQQMAYGL